MTSSLIISIPSHQILQKCNIKGVAYIKQNICIFKKCMNVEIYDFLHYNNWVVVKSIPCHFMQTTYVSFGSRLRGSVTYSAQIPTFRVYIYIIILSIIMSPIWTSYEVHAQWNGIHNIMGNPVIYSCMYQRSHVTCTIWLNWISVILHVMEWLIQSRLILSYDSINNCYISMRIKSSYM